MQEQFAYVYKDGKNGLSLPTLGMGRSGSLDLSDTTDEYFSFIISELQEDRDGDVVVPMGCDLTNFSRNPVWHFGHQELMIPIGTSRAPDGRICVFPEEKRIKARWYPDYPDPDAAFIAGKVKRGILNATSIAFVPIEAHRRDDVHKAHQHGDGASGWVFSRFDLTEVSIVSVPSNAGAVRDMLDAEKSFIRPRLQKALGAYAAQAKGCWNGWCPTCPPALENKTMPKQMQKGVIQSTKDGTYWESDGTQGGGNWVSNISRATDYPTQQAAWRSLGRNGPGVKFVGKSIATKKSLAKRVVQKASTHTIKLIGGKYYVVDNGNGIRYGPFNYADEAREEAERRDPSGSYKSLATKKSCSCSAGRACKAKKSMKKSLTLTRQEYDSLIASDASFMKNEFPKLKRNWGVGGVTVSGDENVLSKLRQMVGKSMTRRKDMDTQYDQGYVAAWDGRGRNTNPYRTDSDERGRQLAQDWDAGWRDGAKERLSERKSVKKTAVAPHDLKEGDTVVRAGNKQIEEIHQGMKGSFVLVFTDGTKTTIPHDVKVMIKALGESSGAAGGYAVKGYNPPFRVVEVRAQDITAHKYGLGSMQVGYAVVDRDGNCVQDAVKSEAEANNFLRKLQNKSAHRCTFCKGTGSYGGQRGGCPDCGGRGAVAKRLVRKAGAWVCYDCNMDFAAPDAGGICPFCGDRNIEPVGKSMKKRRKAYEDDGAEVLSDDAAPPDAAPHEVALAHLYNHAKSEMDYVTEALGGITPFDANTGEANKAHGALKEYGEQVSARMESLKSMFGEHCEGKDIDEAVKGLETSGTDTSNTGEANLVDNGHIPEVEMDLDAEETMEFDDAEEMDFDESGIDPNDETVDAQLTDIDPNAMVEADEEVVEEKDLGGNDECPRCGEVIDGLRDKPLTAPVRCPCGYRGMRKTTDDVEEKEPDEFADDPDTEEILERYQKVAKAIGVEAEDEHELDEIQEQFPNVTWRWNAADGMHDVSGPQAKQFVQAGARRFRWRIIRSLRKPLAQWSTRKAPRGRVRQVLRSGGSVKRGRDGRKWLVAGVSKTFARDVRAGEFIKIVAARGLAGDYIGQSGKVLSNIGGELDVQMENGKKILVRPGSQVEREKSLKQRHKSLTNEGNPAELKSEHAEAVKSCGNMLKGLAAAHDMPEHHKSALDMHGDALAKALGGESDIGEAASKAVKHMKSLADAAPDVPTHHKEAFNHHAKAVGKALKAMGAVEETKAEELDEEEAKAETPESEEAKSHDETEDCRECHGSGRTGNGGICPTCRGSGEKKADDTAEEKSADDEQADEETTKELFAQLAKDATDLRTVKQRTIGAK